MKNFIRLLDTFANAESSKKLVNHLEKNESFRKLVLGTHGTFKTLLENLNDGKDSDSPQKSPKLLKEDDKKS